jgi:hypothetical protein
MDCIQPKKRRESEGGKNRDKRITMVKLIIQKKSSGTATIKTSVCSRKGLDLLLWQPIPGLALCILGFVGEVAAPLVRQLGWGEMAGAFFSCFPWSYVLCVIRRSS